jgi:hypothetical protein
VFINYLLYPKKEECRVKRMLIGGQSRYSSFTIALGLKFFYRKVGTLPIGL